MEQTNSTQLRVVTLGGLLATQFPPQEHLIEPWLRQGRACLMWAAPGVGKTMLALTVALAVAGGGSFIGWTAPKARRVLLIDGEMHAADLRDRCAALLGTVEGIDRESAQGNLVILSRQHQSPDAEFPNISDPADQDTLMDRIQKGAFDLVILDNFSTLAEVRDENNASEMRPVLDFLLRLKQANVACILVHHSNKTGANYRGSTNLATTFEVIMGLQREKGAKDYRASFNIDIGKYREVRDDRTKGRKAWLEETSDGLRWRHEQSIKEEAMELAEAIRSGLYTTDGAAGKALGYDATKTSRLKTAAISEGYIGGEEWRACIRVAREAREEPTPF